MIRNALLAQYLKTRTVSLAVMFIFQPILILTCGVVALSSDLRPGGRGFDCRQDIAAQ